MGMFGCCGGGAFDQGMVKGILNEHVYHHWPPVVVLTFTLVKWTIQFR